ncbi:gp53-like domain-containing protein, partial [Cetobacterium sp.]|uniref:gp53-like domain-containing protein n=1 Tax=Cetobacterium sp. TaxID=2071632 RepID=UPI003F3CC785
SLSEIGSFASKWAPQDILEGSYFGQIINSNTIGAPNSGSQAFILKGSTTESGNGGYKGALVWGYGNGIFSLGQSGPDNIWKWNRIYHDGYKPLADAATKLQTARTIGGVSFDGTSNINLPGVNTAGNQSTSGNAATATKLQTARAINGTNFDGTGAITTAHWGTARTLTLSGAVTGSVSINGSSNVTLATTLSNISGTHSSLISGGSRIHDTRGANRNPDYYPGNTSRWDFVESAKLGCGGDTWTSLLTTVPWTGGSYNASHRQQQLVFTGQGLKWRTATSATAWGSWNTLYSTANKPTAADVGFSESKASNGWMKLPNGMIMQWGYLTYPNNNWNTCTFPIAFTNACANIQMTAVCPGNAGSPSIQVRHDFSKTAFVHHLPGGQGWKAFWIAIGW